MHMPLFHEVLLCCGSKAVGMIVFNLRKELVSLGSRKDSSVGHMEMKGSMPALPRLAFGCVYFPLLASVCLLAI